MNLKKYEATNITPPPNTQPTGKNETYSVYDPEKGINGYVKDGVLYNIKPEAQQQINNNVAKGSAFRNLPAATKLPE